MSRILDIEKIKRSEIIEEPWEHKIIDNFFPEDTFQEIKKLATFLSKNYTIPGKTNPMWMSEVLEAGGNPATVDKIIDAADDILDNIHYLMEDFTDNQYSSQGYFAMPKFGISGNGFSYPVHSESSHKVILFVIYIFPEKDVGTKLYKTKEESSWVKDVEWKENSAFMMTTKNTNMTWHNWVAGSNPSRVTLNIFCEKLELAQKSLLQSTKSDGNEGIIWLYDQFGKNRLTTNKI